MAITIIKNSEFLFRIYFIVILSSTLSSLVQCSKRFYDIIKKEILNIVRRNYQ